MLLGGPLDQLANFLLNYLGPAPKKYREVFLSPLSSLEPIRVPPLSAAPERGLAVCLQVFSCRQTALSFKAAQSPSPAGFGLAAGTDPGPRPQEFTRPQHNGCTGETLGR